MGYGGALIWTGLARNLKREFPNKNIVFIYKLGLRKNADLEIYRNNPDITLLTNQFSWLFIRPWYHRKNRVIVDLSDKRYHYWIDDNREKMIYRQSGHAIAIACEPFQLSSIELKTRLVLTLSEKQRVENILNTHGLLQEPYICIEPNTKKTFTANKQWPWEHWQSFVNLLNNWIREKNLPYKIVQMGAPDSPLLEGVIDLTGSTNFRGVKKIIENATLLVANEGGVAHLAASSETPTIVLCNPSLPSHLMQYPQHINILPQDGVHNCGLKKPCPTCQALLQSIRPDSVFQKTIPILTTTL